MKEIIIIGAGGSAKDIINYLEEDGYQIKGILTDFKDKYEQSNITYPYLGKITKYDFKDTDESIITFGNSPGRLEVFEYMNVRKYKLLTYIHSTAIVGNDVQIGYGSFIGPYNIIGSNTIIGQNVFINKFTNIGHDTILQESVIINPFCQISGNVQIEKNVFIGTHSTILQNVKICKNSIISSNTLVRKNIKVPTMVFLDSKSIQQRKLKD